jgi:hypothetical protein
VFLRPTIMLAVIRARSPHPLRATLVAGIVAISVLAGCAGRSTTDAVQRRDVAASLPPPSPSPPPLSLAAPAASVAAPDPPPPPAPEPVAAPPAPELPLGGRAIFPDYRLVGFCGTPGAPALGPLAYNIPAKAKALKAYADKYPSDRKELLVFELIVVIVQSYEGADKKYRRRVENSVVDEYLAAARQAKALLLLNIQPGQSDFMTELKRFESYLREPDVGVALDPEWAVKAKQKPGVFYGQTTGATINEVAAYMGQIVKDGNLPEKALVFHQLNRYVVKDESALVPQTGVVIIKSVDGLGPKHAKILTYNDLMKTMAPGVHPGFKLFLDEDKRIGGRVMSPAEVMKLTPQPEYVMVE